MDELQIEASHGTCRRRGLFRPGACSCAPSSTCSARHLLHSHPDRARRLTLPYRRVRRVWCVIIEQPGCGSMRRRVLAWIGSVCRFRNDFYSYDERPAGPVGANRFCFVSFYVYVTRSAYTVRSAPAPVRSPEERGFTIDIFRFIPPAQRRLASYARCAHVSDVVRVLTLWLRSRSRVHRPGIRSRDTPRCRVRVRGRGGGACRVLLFDPTASTSGAAPLPRAYDEHYVPARGQLLTSPSAARERDMQAHFSLETKSVTNALRRNDGAYAPRTAAFDLFPKNSSFFSRRVKIRACGAGRPTRCPIQARSNVGSVGCLL